MTSFEYAVLFTVVIAGALVLWSKLGGVLDRQIEQGTDALDATLARATQTATQRERVPVYRAAGARGQPTGVSALAESSAAPANQPVQSTAGGTPTASPAAEGRGLLSRAGNTVVEFGKIMADTTLGAIAGVTPYGGFIPVRPPFGHERAFGLGMMVGSGAGMILDASVAGGDALLTSTGVLAPLTVPAAAGIAVAATGHMANWEKGAVMAMQGQDGPPASNKPSPNPAQEQPRPGALQKGKPNPSAKAHGEPEPIDPRAKSTKQADVARQNDSADVLARDGYDISHNRDVLSNGKQPDYKISGQYVDHYSPRSNNIDQVRKTVSTKVSEGQADRLVVRLDDTTLTAQEVTSVLQRKPVEGLKEVIIIKDGRVTSYFP